MKEHERDVKKKTRTSAPFQHWEEHGHAMKNREIEISFKEQTENPRILIEGLAIEFTDKKINLLEGKRLNKMYGRQITKKVEREIRSRLF